jgi:hypothetical protein
MLKTKFWQNAAASLPEGVRTRHLADIEQAERIELALDGAIEALARVKSALTFKLASPSEQSEASSSSSG